MPPSWIHIPIGYHGRASSVVVSDTAVHRPKGAVPTANGPIFAASKALDFELEIAAVVGGPGNVMGQRLKTSDVEENIFGLVLMNDLSARDGKINHSIEGLNSDPFFKCKGLKWLRWGLLMARTYAFYSLTELELHSDKIS
jgi:2-keto-4-pentenoate hydratase/2-oxohepta-3-ene-1,7-dioic acid hydratase in catechol pathway